MDLGGRSDRVPFVRWEEEGAADAILLQDPAGQNSFVVNQADLIHAAALKRLGATCCREPRIQERRSNKDQMERTIEHV